MSQRRQFRIIETLGRGGFGTVYRAEMMDAGGFSKQVALKVLHYKGEAANEMKQRLRDEARVLGLIRHRAVVGVSGLVPLEDGWGVVMDFVEGADLSNILRAGGAPPRGVSLEIIEEIAAALDAAHNARPQEDAEPLHLVHRDIKAANIRVTRQGEVKLLDFGVARAHFAAREADESAQFVMGSKRTMAPERRAGHESHQGDVYGVGVVLANLLTGKRFKPPPTDEGEHSHFVGTILETVGATLTGHESADEREALNGLRHLLLEMLAFHPEDRPDGGMVARRLRRFRAQLPPPALRDWADTNIPRLKKEPSTDDDTGRIISELQGVELTPPPDVPKSPQASTNTLRTVFLTISVLLLLVILGATLWLTVLRPTI